MCAAVAVVVDDSDNDNTPLAERWLRLPLNCVQQIFEDVVEHALSVEPAPTTTARRATRNDDADDDDADDADAPDADADADARAGDAERTATDWPSIAGDSAFPYADDARAAFEHERRVYDAYAVDRARVHAGARALLRLASVCRTWARVVYGGTELPHRRLYTPTPTTPTTPVHTVLFECAQSLWRPLVLRRWSHLRSMQRELRVKDWRRFYRQRYRSECERAFAEFEDRVHHTHYARVPTIDVCGGGGGAHRRQRRAPTTTRNNVDRTIDNHRDDDDNDDNNNNRDDNHHHDNNNNNNRNNRNNHCNNTDEHVPSVHSDDIEEQRAASDAFLLRCPMKWYALAPIAGQSDTRVRFCDECRRSVHRVSTLRAAVASARAGECVMFAPAEPRAPPGAYADDGLIGIIDIDNMPD